MNNEDKKERFTLWMKHSTFEKVEENYREDNCQKKSEFIENAVNFYCGYLKMNSSEPFLSTVLRATLKKLGSTEKLEITRKQEKNKVYKRFSCIYNTPKYGISVKNHTFWGR